MTKRELEQIYYLDKELRMLDRELERLRGQSLVQSPLPNETRGTSVSDKVGKLAQKRVDLEHLIRDKRREIQQLRDKAVQYIYSIPDSLTRQIVYYRCVSLMSWRRVAYEVGGDEQLTVDSGK